MSSHATTLLRAHPSDRRRRFWLSTLALSLLSFLLIPSVAFAQTPPAAQGKTATTTEDTPVTIDTGVTYDPLYEIQQTNAGPNSPVHGSMSAGPIINNKYTINYTPGPNRIDAVSFQYHLCMNIPPGSCGTAATINVTITAVNDAPTADDDVDTTLEDTPININVLDGDNAGPADENQALAIIELQNPTTKGGSVAIVSGLVRYTPPADFCNESDTFTYRVQDSLGLKSGEAVAPNPIIKAQVTVNVTCVNDKPIANSDTITVTEDTLNNIIDVLANDSFGPANEAGQTLAVFDIVTPPTQGTAVINLNKIEYTPKLNFCGSDSFEYRNQDNGTGLPISAKARVNVVVTCVLDKPLLSVVPKLDANSNVLIDDHIITFDVILTSPDENVSGVNFDLNYSCLTSPVVEPGSTPPVPPFYVQVQDSGNKLGFLIGNPSNQLAVLAGPSASAQRKLATVKFSIASSCTINNLAGVSLNFSNYAFSGPNAANIVGGNVVDLNSFSVTANEPPTNISLSPNSVVEGVAGSFVGFLSTTDADVGDTFLYELPAIPTCSGLNDNASFEIPTNANYLKLQPNVAANFVTKSTYSVCVRSKDNYKANVDKLLTVQVVQGNVAPDAVDDGMPFPTFLPIPVLGPTTINVLGNDTDVNGANTISISAVTNSTHGIVINNGTNVTFIATDAKYLGLNTFSYTIKDNGGLTDTANVTVKIERDFEPGNCNRFGVLDAGDLTAWGLEFFDGDDNNKWYQTPGGTYNGSPYGCNANQNSQIDAGDLTCIGILYFGGVCNPAVLSASTTNTASLAVSSGLTAAPGATVDVPILLTSAGNHVSAAAFAVDFDASALSFDATDADGNGLPDAVNLNIPSGLFTMVNYNATESRIEILVTGMTLPFPQLADGTLATVKLTVNADASGRETAIQLSNSSLGNNEGMPVPLEVADGTVQIDVAGQSQLNRLYLPTIQK